MSNEIIQKPEDKAAFSEATSGQGFEKFVQSLLDDP